MSTLTDHAPAQRRDRPAQTRLWQRVLARGLAFRLDARIAAGAASRDDRLCAPRRALLISRRQRGQLGEGWQRLLLEARAPSSNGLFRVRPCRARIVDAEPCILELLAVLASPSPIDARGVALARRLLTDGTGPVYNPRSTADLSHALREAIDHLGSG